MIGGIIVKKIKLIATGGTISAHHPDRTDLSNYTSGVYTGEDFLKEIPELGRVAHIDVEQLANFSSTLITPTHWLQLKKKVNKALIEENYDGVVITHGTNTLEETAYFLHLTVGSAKPVVLVGAQRPFSGLSSDAQMNLIHAIRVASSEKSIGKGVLVVLNDEISCARDVTKTNTYRLETFQSRQLGFLGYVDPDQTVQFYHSPERTHTIHSEFSTLQVEQLPHVEIVYSYAGTDGNLIRWLTKYGDAAGIVVAGTGAGRCSDAEEEALREARKKGIHVVLSSRVGSGRVVPIDHYKDMEAITSDNLLPQKARILLMLSLVKYNDPKQIQQLFDQY